MFLHNGQKPWLEKRKTAAMDEDGHGGVDQEEEDSEEEGCDEDNDEEDTVAGEENDTGDGHG